MVRARIHPWLLGAGLAMAVLTGARATEAPPAPAYQTPEAAAGKSTGCISCHTKTDSMSMHPSEGVLLGCADCHGGNPAVMRPAGIDPSVGGPRVVENAAGVYNVPHDRHFDPAYKAAMDKAHVLPHFPERWPTSAKPERSYAWLNQESPEFVRFINPSDYRVARESCGACHLQIIQQAERSLMSTVAMFWGGAAYNNGILPFKHYVLGEGYTHDGQPATIKNPGTADEAAIKRGVLDQVVPMPAWEVTPPADNFRVFELGGRTIGSEFAEVGLPNSSGNLQLLEEPGRPDIKQSNRGPGTGLRISVPVLNITKSRLNDPNAWFLGTNDQPGDYRSSGCASCHVVYANDRDPLHSMQYAKFGNTGMSQSVDPTIPHGEPGHPLEHVFTREIPTSQCMVCHMHQPNIFMNTFMGYTMWDYESDAPSMWPKKQRYPSDEEIFKVIVRNPEEAAPKGKWGDRDFLKDVSKLNPELKDTQFADYHGHGWNFRAVFKRDRKGDLLDAKGNIVSNDDPDKFHKAVHLASIHMDKGMQCVDCHFEQDMHGNGLIYQEVAAAIEITCVDCHGTVDSYPNLRTSGPAAQPGGRTLFNNIVAGGRTRFEWRDGKLYQRSAVDPKLEWEVHLVKDTVDPKSPMFNPKAARAKLMSKDTGTLAWGPNVKPGDRAHANDDMNCMTCHTSWTTSCAGCHLPIQANWKTERHHYEGEETRNYATYDPQVARDDMFQLGRHADVKGNVIAPIRSSSALVLSSTNSNRDRIYIQQPPIAASGYSSQAFAPHYPHTERTVETKTCDDCHLSKTNNNNAIMAQLLLLGTNFVNFIGYNAWVGEEGSIEAVQVTEWDEPQAVIGSYLHKYAYPDWYKQHQDRGRELPHTESHSSGIAQCIQLRGEYLYVAEGAAGMRVYDVASIANKDVSEKIITAPASPLGQDTHIGSKDATCVALPTNQPIAPNRNQGKLMSEVNHEQPFHPIYHYAFITDSQEGLIATNVDTMADRDPLNNFLTRALTWNEGGVLTGARHLTIAGHIFYVSTPRGVVVLDMDDPMKPKVIAQIPLAGARATAVQFRYLWVTDDKGLDVVDITHPDQPRLVEGATVPLADAHRVYVARTFAYVAAGAQGLAIVDVEQPEHPRVYQMFTADGRIHDARDVVVGTTNASLFAYVADGVGGLKVIQLTSPDSQPNFYGFSPDPKPELIATRATRNPALALSKGLDRDRGVDETGHQIAIFGRLGSRPFTLPEMQQLYLRPDGKPWWVDDTVDMAAYRGPQPLPPATPAGVTTTAVPAPATGRGRATSRATLTVPGEPAPAPAAPRPHPAPRRPVAVTPLPPAPRPQPNPLFTIPGN